MPLPLHIAIIGSGLSGLTLATSLSNNSIPFTLYESRATLTEIGAGINFNPSALQSLRIINPSLGEKLFAAATRNPPPDEEIGFYFRYGAAADDDDSALRREEGEVVLELKASPTGNMAFHRRELLKLLAEGVGITEHVKFGKRFVGYRQDNKEGVKLEFADGSTEVASVVIACDGIHSKVRSAMFGGPENVVSSPSYNYTGCYRAVIPVEKAVAAIGEGALRGTIYLGPKGYIITYPVSGGKFVNCGAWPGKKDEEWDCDEWVKHNQRPQLMKDFEEWGETMKRVIDLFPEDVAFWTSHQHFHQPEQFRDGRVFLIGDAAHAMPPCDIMELELLKLSKMHVCLQKCSQSSIKTQLGKASSKRLCVR